MISLFLFNGKFPLRQLHLHEMNYPYDFYVHTLKFLGAGKHQSILLQNFASEIMNYTYELSWTKKMYAVKGLKSFREFFKPGPDASAR